MFSASLSSTTQKSSAAAEVSLFGARPNSGGSIFGCTDSKSGQKTTSGDNTLFGAKPLESIKPSHFPAVKALTSSSIAAQTFAAPLTGTLSSPTDSSHGKVSTSSIGSTTFATQKTDSKSTLTDFSFGTSAFFGQASNKSVDTSPQQSNSKNGKDSSCDQLSLADISAASKFTQTDPLFGHESLTDSAAQIFGASESKCDSTKPISLELPTVFTFGFFDSSNGQTSSSATSAQPIFGAQKVTPSFSGISPASIRRKPTEGTKALVDPFNNKSTTAVSTAPTFGTQQDMKFRFRKTSGHQTSTALAPTFGKQPLGFQFTLMDSSPIRAATTGFGAAPLYRSQEEVSPHSNLSKFPNSFSSKNPVDTLSIKYRSTIGSEPCNRGWSNNINTRTHCITAMTEFMNKSLEELRLEYLENQSDKKRLQELLEGINVEDKKPSVLLEVMLIVAGGIIEEKKLKSLWFRKISPAIGDILSVSCDDLQRLGKMADIINEKLECSRVKKADLTAPVGDSNMRLDHVESVMGEMMKQMESLSTVSSQQGKSDTHLSSSKQSRYQRNYRHGNKMRKANGKLSQKSEEK